MINFLDEKEKRWRRDILNNWDEIAERLVCGQAVDLNTFVPDSNRKIKKNNAIEKTLQNKQKL